MAWSDTFPPYLEMLVDPVDGTIPHPSRIQQAFQLAPVGKRFYDSNTEVKRYADALEAWTKATLRLKCGMKPQAILELWETEFHDTPGPNEGVLLSQQVRRVHDRINEIVGMPPR